MAGVFRGVGAGSDSETHYHRQSPVDERVLSGRTSPSSTMANPPEVEQLLLTAHDCIGRLKAFVSAQEAENRKLRRRQERRDRVAKAAAEGQPRDQEGGGGGYISSGSESEDEQDVDNLSGSTDDLFDGMMQYIRGTVLNVLKGGARSAPGRVKHTAQQAAAMKTNRHKESEASQLRALLRATVMELDAERAEKHNLVNEMRQFNALLEDFRRENNILQVYKDRIVELQAVVNGTKKPGDLNVEIGLEEELVPAGINRTEEQKRKEVANEVARLAVQSKDKADRLLAERLKIQSDNVALIGQNSILTDRVKVLEAQLSVLTASSSVALRELSKQRLQAAIAVEAPAHIQKKLKASQVRIGGIVMEAEVAVWLKDMYLKLLHDPDASQSLMEVKEVPPDYSPALITNAGGGSPAVVSPSPLLPTSPGNSPGRPPAPASGSPALANPHSRAATPGTTPTPAGRPATQQGPRTRDGKTFSEFVADKRQ